MVKIKLTVLLVLSSFIMACSGDGEQNYAHTPMDCIHSGGTTCQSYYNGSQFYGSYSRPLPPNFYRTFSNGVFHMFPNCSFGYQTVANPTFGMACIPRSMINLQNYSMYQIPLYGGQFHAVPFSCMSHSHCVSGYCAQSQFSPIGLCRR